jgi:hypothetical protein
MMLSSLCKQAFRQNHVADFGGGWVKFSPAKRKIAGLSSALVGFPYPGLQGLVVRVINCQIC